MYTPQEILEAVDDLIREQGLELGSDYTMAVGPMFEDKTDGSALISLDFGNNHIFYLIVMPAPNPPHLALD